MIGSHDADRDYNAIAVMIQTYLNGIRTALVAPWRVNQTAPGRGSRRRVVLWAAMHILVAAGICTLSSNWVNLAAKGVIKGAHEMDTGGRAIPPDSMGQVVGGLAASVGLWAVLLVLVIGVSALVADWVYLRDGFAFSSAVRGAANLSIWFVVWAVLMFVGNLERGDRFLHPARWPTGQTWEVRDRLIFLVAAFPVVWALAAPARVGVDGRPRRIGVFVGGVVLSWVVWALLWRTLPWVAIEAYTG